MRRNAQEPERSGIEMQVGFAALIFPEYKMSAPCKEPVAIRKRGHLQGVKLLAARTAEQDLVFLVPYEARTLERGSAEVCRKRDEQRLEVVEMPARIGAQHEPVVAVAVHRVIEIHVEHGIHVICHGVQAFLVCGRERMPRCIAHHSGNQEEVVDKLDIFRSLLAVHPLGRILLEDFAFEPRLRIFQARIAMRDIPHAGRDEQARILRNQVVIRRGTERRMPVGIFRVFTDHRPPRFRYELLDSAVFLAQAVNIQQLPAKSPADKPQVHLDIAVPVHAHHVRVRIAPHSQMVAEQHEMF